MNYVTNAFGVVLISVIVCFSQTTLAQCDCTHTFSPGATVINGTEQGIQPGDTICIEAGNYEFLRFQEIHGSADAPVKIINCGGQVVIHNEDRAYGLVLEGASAFVQITGTGDSAIEYGFDVSAPDKDPWPGVALVLGDKSTNYEIDHMEVHHTGFAGVTCKTDPQCDGSADQDVFVQRDVALHHLYVHDTGGEGFYIGSTQSNGHTITCDGTQEVHQPHYLEGIQVHHNIIERTGWDGAQIGMARSNCAFYANTIVDVGGAGEQYQQQGLQIGAYSSCEVYNNIIMDGPAMGIIVLGAGDSRFYNNLVVDFGEDGIYANQQDFAAGATWEFYYNTIVDYTRNGLRVHGADLGAVIVQNNLIVGAEGQLAIGNEVPNVTESGNLTPTSVDGLFVSDNDFHLVETSPARGAGTAINNIDFDLDGQLRATSPSVGAYEYLADSPGTATDIELPAPATTSQSDDGSDSDGCGCRLNGAVRMLSILSIIF
ncbi:MAG: right-handed parallel beta-helix repeat-containing protein [Deltaproteobacteria bacterium]|nr:right-handed parallel beta-helix repeat-containing protein [Deltaproteobacteria bacterium]